MKTQSMSIKEFMSGDYKNKAINQLKKHGEILYSSGGVMVLALKSSGDTFGNLHGSLMTAFDSGVVLVIIFSGACWCLGHRSKALEILIGVCCGYILARHAIDIRDYLKSI